jgi:hypothetical protein
MERYFVVISFLAARKKGSKSMILSVASEKRKRILYASTYWACSNEIVSEEAVI